jgi:hypothetical protein
LSDRRFGGRSPGHYDRSRDQLVVEKLVVSFAEEEVAERIVCHRNAPPKRNRR